MQRSTRIIIDMIVATLALMVLLLVVLPGITSFVGQTQATADTLNVKLLNEATTAYRLLNGIDPEDVFTGYVTDEARMQILVDAKYLLEAPVPQQSDASFRWDSDELTWILVVQGDAAPLTSLGSTFTEISSAMIDLELKRKEETGSFGRSWGRYAYTDLGLNPEDWESPVGHIYYKPAGSQIMISPEEGYTIFAEDMSGKERKLPAAYNWNLVGDCATGTWYYHTIGADTQIDIATLRVVEG